MTVEVIKDAIRELSAPERSEVADWIQELKEEARDRKIEADFRPGGRVELLVARLDAEIDAGLSPPYEEGPSGAMRVTEQLREQAFDRRIEQDCEPGGRAQPLLARLRRELKSWSHSSLEEGIRQRRDITSATSSSARSGQ